MAWRLDLEPDWPAYTFGTIHCNFAIALHRLKEFLRFAISESTMPMEYRSGVRPMLMSQRLIHEDLKIEPVHQQQ
jgi:hypothetical protein